MDFSKTSFVRYECLKDVFCKLWMSQRRLLYVMVCLKDVFCMLWYVWHLLISETILKRESRKIYSFKETNKASEIYYYQSIWKLMTHWIVHEPKPDFIIIVSRGWWRTTPLLVINYKNCTSPHSVFVHDNAGWWQDSVSPMHCTHYIIYIFCQVFFWIWPSIPWKNSKIIII